MTRVRAAVREFGSGLGCGLRGLLVKELRTRGRGWRAMWLLTGYLVLLGAAVTSFLGAVAIGTGAYPASSGLVTFYALAFGSVLLLAFITPALTSGAISGERERRTLDLLLVTRASALGIACGKLAGSLLYVVFLLIASLPAFALVWLFGGIQPRYVLLVVAVALVTVTSYAALGMLFSAVLRRTAVATIASYLVVLLLMAGFPLGWTIVTSVASGQGQRIGPPGFAVGVSPMASLFSILASGETFGDSGGGSERVPITHMAFTVYDPKSPSPERVVTWAPWVYHFSSSAVIVVASLAVTALSIHPLKPWRSWRPWRSSRPRAGVPAERGTRLAEHEA